MSCTGVGVLLRILVPSSSLQADSAGETPSLDGHCWYRLLHSAILLAASARVPALPILSVYAVNVDDLPPRYLRLTRNAT